jgi:site-specific recombinase
MNNMIDKNLDLELELLNSLDILIEKIKTKETDEAKAIAKSVLYLIQKIHRDDELVEKLKHLIDANIKNVESKIDET